MNEILPIGEPAAPRLNVPEFTVSELSQAVKRTVEGAFALVRVRGEISQFKRHTSGHVYLCLKDADAVIDGVIWRGSVARLGLKPEDGMEVICTGRVTTYPGRSKYQLVIERMELAGEGALLKMIEERKKRLAAEGLFDEQRKKRLPFLPEVIGVVTSPTGAVIRDILHRLEDRFPRRVLVWPVAVQGDGAAEQVASAIRGFNALSPDGAPPRPDLLIVARGGGSLEDLMAFNEEIVVRAAAASAIPLISAVGHETDTTLIDFASDRRAPTPTAAAEMAVPVRVDLIADVMRDGQRLVAGLQRMLAERRTELKGAARGLGDPTRLIEQWSQRVDDHGERMDRAVRQQTEVLRTRVAHASARLPHPQQQLDLAWQTFRDRLARLAACETVMRRGMEQHCARAGELLHRAQAAAGRTLADRQRHLASAAQLLESYSYERVLERGFALVHDAEGAAITSVEGARDAGSVALRFRDGEVGARVESDAARPTRGKSKPSPPPKTQGRLL
jgi:exodeoxyribonuclease VII large subunit